MYQYKEISLNVRNHELRFKGHVIYIPRREYILIELLISNPIKTFARQYLLEAMYGLDDSIESNVLEVHIHGLRKKFGKDYIKTVRGFGYKMHD